MVRGSIDGIPVLIIAKHMVSGAWRQGDARARTSRVDLRRELWRRDYRATRRLIARAHRRGLTVIVAGDLNRLDMPGWLPGQTAVSAGLIHQAVIPAPGVTVSNHQVTCIPSGRLHTDHPILSATYTLEDHR